jgi:hypothetical protein
MWLEEVRGRERGELRAGRFEASARARRAGSLALSNRKEFATPHHGAVNSLQVPASPRSPQLASSLIADPIRNWFIADLTDNFIKSTLNHRSLLCDLLSRLLVSAI